MNRAYTTQLKQYRNIAFNEHNCEHPGCTNRKATQQLVWVQGKVNGATLQAWYLCKKHSTKSKRVQY